MSIRRDIIDALHDGPFPWHLARLAVLKHNFYVTLPPEEIEEYVDLRVEARFGDRCATIGAMNNWFDAKMGPWIADHASHTWGWSGADEHGGLSFRVSFGSTKDAAKFKLTYFDWLNNRNFR